MKQTNPHTHRSQLLRFRLNSLIGSISMGTRMGRIDRKEEGLNAEKCISSTLHLILATENPKPDQYCSQTKASGCRSWSRTHVSRAQIPKYFAAFGGRRQGFKLSARLQLPRNRLGGSACPPHYCYPSFHRPVHDRTSTISITNLGLLQSKPHSPLVPDNTRTSR